MRLLLDTRIFLWLQTEPERLGEQLQTVSDVRNELFLSAASSWEIAIKHGLGTLPLPAPPDRYVPQRMQAIGAVGVPVEHSHALAITRLPDLHRDPIDRLLVAQASVLELTLLTADPAVAQYPLPTLLV